MKFVVFYAKLAITDDVVKCENLFFGGLRGSMAEAEELAKDCSSAAKNGVNIPKVIELNPDDNVIDISINTQELFENMAKQMTEAEQTIRATQEKRRRKKIKK